MSFWFHPDCWEGHIENWEIVVIGRSQGSSPSAEWNASIRTNEMWTKQCSPDSWPGAHGLQVAEYINMSCFLIKMWWWLLFYTHYRQIGFMIQIHNADLLLFR